jgi:hypothetical protein
VEEVPNDEQSIASAVENARQDAQMDALRDRVIANEEVIKALAEGQVELTKSMAEINTTLNMLLKMGRPVMLLMVGIFGALGIDMTGVVA